MAMSIRLSDEANGLLDRLVKEGHYRTKAEAVRAALNTLFRIQEEKKRGRRLISVSDKTLKEANIALELS